MHSYVQSCESLLLEEALLVFEAQVSNTEQHRKDAAAIQNAVQCNHPIYDERERATIQTSLDHFFQAARQNWIQQGTRTRAINIRRKWNFSLPSISYCWRSFSCTISHLLQSVTLLVCSLDISPCASSCTILLYFSRYCAERLKICVCVFSMYYLCEKVLQTYYSTVLNNPLS